MTATAARHGGAAWVVSQFDCLLRLDLHRPSSGRKLWFMSKGPPTFGIKTSRDMLRKLHWELDQLANTEDHDDQTAAYHCFNAAVTAWHLHEWIWLEIKRDDKLRARLAREAGVPPQKFKKHHWAEFMQKRHPFYEVLRYCKIIATASKHAGVELTDEDPMDLEVYASARSTLPDSPGSNFETSWRWKIRIGDKVLPAEFVLESAGHIWREFIDEIGIAGD